MKLSSSAFVHNGHIPVKYTCEGDNVSPPLTIEFIPALAKSLVLIVDDPDIPDVVKKSYHIQMWDHWIVFNIPTTVKEIKEDSTPGTLGAGTLNKVAYQGPCPPDKQHRYFFKLYALDTKLTFSQGATKRQIEEAMDGRIIAKTELIGLYEKKKK